MPKVTYNGNTIVCKKGANLRKVLLERGINPHNGSARMVNCFGSGTCGTCAVRITGKVAPYNKKEEIRLNLAPYSVGNGLRLSCQIKVNSDLVVEKGEGFWGQTI